MALPSTQLPTIGCHGRRSKCMARINIEDKWLNDPRRDRLSALLGNLSGKPELGSILADGSTQKLWKLSQTYWQKGELIPGHIFIHHFGAKEILLAGLARVYQTQKIWLHPDPCERYPDAPQRAPNDVERELNEARTRWASVRDIHDLSVSWIYACGSREHHFWLIEAHLQRVGAGKKSAEKRRLRYGTAQPSRKFSSETRSRSECSSNDARTTSNGAEPSNSSSVSSSDSNSSLSLISLSPFEKLEREILEKFPDDKERLEKAYKYFDQEKKDLRGESIRSIVGLLRSSWSVVREQFAGLGDGGGERMKECPHKALVSDPHRPGISSCVACKTEFNNSERSNIGSFAES